MNSKKVVLEGKEQSYQRGCHIERLKILYSTSKDTNPHQKKSTEKPPVFTTHRKVIWRMKLF